MRTARSRFRTPLGAVLAAWLVAGLAGCHAIDFYDQSLSEPVQPGMEPPREKSLVKLPAYRIAPPDLLQIEMLKQVPLPPYRAESYDVLQINVMGTLLDQPIDNYYLIEADGRVNLGPAYGTVRVAGMTIQEARATITQHLMHYLAHPEVSVQLARASGTQEVTGQFLVAMDGTVHLRRYGTVHLAGKTVAEAKAELEKHLSQYFDSPQVAVSVLNFNSKIYYIITEGANLGDTVLRVPITGKEKVLDALSNVGGLSEAASKEIWIARPAPGSSDCEQILPIDYDAITRGASAATNYQLMPGDRVYVAENRVVALSNLVAIVKAPFERAIGIASLGTSMVKNLAQLGRGYNRSFRR